MIFPRLLAALSLSALFAAPCLAIETGVRDFSLAAPEGGRRLQVTVWYPAEPGGKAVLVGDNQVFRGAPALSEAPFLEGRYPLVVMSHGSGGRIQGMSWLAAELASARP
ncbi:hypothetical protein [Sinorhizobium americanum]|uniref:Lipoprotein signal peptide n=1 Tax=Sinorhizobium americanum TaxID=194963 RepID=A0A1L3LVJ5_9HYPH|nr:hypothetical protein [Sinorhizobium americanum]APG94139.1 lipoprotein signal peptide [Sinorhizobium americanum]